MGQSTLNRPRESVFVRIPCLSVFIMRWYRETMRATCLHQKKHCFLCIPLHSIYTANYWDTCVKSRQHFDFECHAHTRFWGLQDILKGKSRFCLGSHVVNSCPPGNYGENLLKGHGDKTKPMMPGSTKQHVKFKSADSANGHEQISGYASVWSGEKSNSTGSPRQPRTALQCRTFWLVNSFGAAKHGPSLVSACWRWFYLPKLGQLHLRIRHRPEIATSVQSLLGSSTKGGQPQNSRELPVSSLVWILNCGTDGTARAVGYWACALDGDL